MQSESAAIHDLVRRLSDYRYVLGSESSFQDGVAEVLRSQGIAHVQEHNLGRKFGRVDFYLPSLRTGIELKVQGSPSAVIRQIHRYTLCPEIDAMVLLSGRARLARLPESMNGKPVVSAVLWWGQL